MMRNFLLFLAIPFALLLTGCKKQGCVDPKATNYSDAANKDDGSCTYSETLIFWQDLTAANSWAPLGVTSLKFYVNGQYIGSCLAAEYMTGIPSCTQQGQSSLTIDFGKNTSANVQVTVKDQTDYVWYNEQITVIAGSCNYYQVF